MTNAWKRVVVALCAALIVIAPPTVASAAWPSATAVPEVTKEPFTHLAQRRSGGGGFGGGGGGYRAPPAYRAPAPSYSPPVYRAPAPSYSPPAYRAPPASSAPSYRPNVAPSYPASPPSQRLATPPARIAPPPPPPPRFARPFAPPARVVGRVATPAARFGLGTVQTFARPPSGPLARFGSSPVMGAPAFAVRRNPIASTTTAPKVASIGVSGRMASTFDKVARPSASVWSSQTVRRAAVVGAAAGASTLAVQSATAQGRAPANDTPRGPPIKPTSAKIDSTGPYDRKVSEQGFRVWALGNKELVGRFQGNPNPRADWRGTNDPSVKAKLERLKSVQSGIADLRARMNKAPSNDLFAKNGSPAASRPNVLVASQAIRVSNGSVQNGARQQPGFIARFGSTSALSGPAPTVQRNANVSNNVAARIASLGGSGRTASASNKVASAGVATATLPKSVRRIVAVGAGAAAITALTRVPAKAANDNKSQMDGNGGSSSKLPYNAKSELSDLPKFFVMATSSRTLVGRYLPDRSPRVEMGGGTSGIKALGAFKQSAAIQAGLAKLDSRLQANPNNDNPSLLRSLPSDVKAKILKIGWGSRPDPSTYMTKEQIQARISLFDGGLTKIKREAPKGTEGPPGGTFVMPKLLADELIRSSRGDVRKLEKMLGLNSGDLGNNPVRVDIHDNKSLRIPNGNEYGANEKWVPGGTTKGGIPEAVVDPIPEGGYTVKDLWS